jgi:hypothetical protein
MKVVRLSALRTGRLYPPVNIPGTDFSYNDTVGLRTRDLPLCSAVPQPTAPPRAILNIYSRNILTEYFKHAAHFPFFFSLFNMQFIS